MGKLLDLASVILSRSALATRAGKTFEGARDVYKALGYDRLLDFNKYYERYKREGIAARIVDTFASATWSRRPTIEADEEFVKAWDEFALRLSVYHYLERLDKLAGIGRYGTLLFGVRGGSKLSERLIKVKDADAIIFFSVFHEGHSTIKGFEDNPGKETFGLPSSYELVLSVNETNNSTNTTIADASRVIHVAENVMEDEIFGLPRLERSWNYLDDLTKITGASAEAIWRVSERGIQFNVDKDAELKSEDEAVLVDEIEEYLHDFKRYMLTQGVEANVLGSNTVDPRGAADVIVSLISGTTGIPQRILMGSERGQLASGHDERNFSFRVQERRISFAEPKILRPFIDKLISIEALPTPTDGYKVKWPDLVVLSEKDKADVAARYGQAISNFAGQTKERMPVVSAQEFRETWLGLEGDVPADAIPDPVEVPIEEPILEDPND